MRTLNRNKRKLYYRKYLGRSVIKKNDLETGEYKNRYSNLRVSFQHISAGRGERYIRDFGSSLKYDRKLITSKTDLVEGDILWVDCLPIERSGRGFKYNTHDYEVVAKLESLNQDLLAIRKVRVDG